MTGTFIDPRSALLGDELTPAAGPCLRSYGYRRRNHGSFVKLSVRFSLFQGTRA